MKQAWSNRRAVSCGTAAVFCITAALCAKPSPGEKKNASGNQPPVAESSVEQNAPVPVEIARDRAKLMHEIYAATLDVMHARYFHVDRATLPARAMEDIFSKIKRQSHTDARWISVSLKAMSVSHEPKSDFEKKAAGEIAAGKAAVEVVGDGYYRRAGAIVLTDGCIGCHAGFLKEPPKSPKFAGLVISVPIISDSGKPE